MNLVNTSVKEHNSNWMKVIKSRISKFLRPVKRQFTNLKYMPISLAWNSRKIDKLQPPMFLKFHLNIEAILNCTFHSCIFLYFSWQIWVQQTLFLVNQRILRMLSSRYIWVYVSENKNNLQRIWPHYGEAKSDTFASCSSRSITLVMEFLVFWVKIR